MNTELQAEPSSRLAGGGLTLVGLGLAEMAAARAGRSLVDAVAGVAVDHAPLPLIEGGVRLLGTTDKPALRLGVLCGAALGGAMAAGGHVRVGAGPGVLAAVAGVAAYAAARRRLTRAEGEQDVTRPQIEVAAPLSDAFDGAEGWANAEPLFTDVGRFYVTDVKMRAPLVDVSTWRLAVEDLDGQGTELTYDDLLALPLRERDALLICVHNRLGWDRLGHQRWTGVPLEEVFEAADVALPADPAEVDVVMEATDGYIQTMPLDRAIADRSWLVLGMGRRALSASHGFPARVLTPGVVGQYNGVKWLRRLALAPRGQVTATWVARGWPDRTIVPPPMARFDHPGEVRMPPRLPQGTIEVTGDVTAVGTAWAPANGGVRDVQVRVDEGDWTSAELADDLGPDSWRRWRLRLGLPAGPHLVSARCIAVDGTVQQAEPRAPFPDGATGHHTLRLSVR